MANIIASRLRDKEVVTDTGVRIGELYDISMSESPGLNRGILPGSGEAEIGVPLSSTALATSSPSSRT